MLLSGFVELGILKNKLRTSSEYYSDHVWLSRSAQELLYYIHESLASSDNSIRVIFPFNTIISAIYIGKNICTEIHYENFEEK